MNTGESPSNLVWGCIRRPFSIICVKLSLCTADGEVKATQAVSWQRVRAALKNHSTGLVHLHHLSHHLWEHSTKSSAKLSSAWAATWPPSVQTVFLILFLQFNIWASGQRAWSVVTQIVWNSGPILSTHKEDVETWWLKCRHTLENLL